MKTFEDLCQMEPKIQRLFESIPFVMTNESEPNEEWRWVKIKRGITRLVGWEAERTELREGYFYDVVFRKCREAAEAACPRL